MGVPAVPAGGVPAPARTQPAATQGVLRPPVPADDHRRVRPRVRPVRQPARQRDPAPVRPEGARPRSHRGRRPQRRASAARRGDHLMPTTAPAVAAAPRRSVFAGADVCHTAGLALLPDAKRPVFEQDVWDLTGLADAHRGMRPHAKVFNFTRITNPTWRVVAKELVLALLAPGHEAVTHLPNAFRAARGPQTCAHTLDRLTEWFNWLTAHGVVSLGEIIQEHCDAYLQDRSW